MLNKGEMKVIREALEAVQNAERMESPLYWLTIAEDRLLAVLGETRG